VKSYTYTATDDDGNVHHNAIDATDLSQAIAQLAELNLVVLAIALRDEATVNQERQSKVFEGNLSQLVERRDAWIPALHAVCEELPSGPTRREMQGLLRELRSPHFDRPLPALFEHPAILQLLPILQESDDALASRNPLHEWLSGMLKQRQLRTEQRKRFIYPLFLIGLTLLILISFACFVIPIFREMYEEFGLRLPPPTALTFWIAEQATTYLPRSLAFGLGLILLCIPVARYWRGRSLSNRLLGRHVAGTSSNLLAMSTLTSTLTHMLSLGAPPAEALRIAGKASRSFFYERAAVELSEQIDKSAGVTPSLSSRALPPTLLYALQAEAGGSPSLPLLQSLAQIYGERAQSRIDLVTTMMPIVAVVAVGLGVGFVIISLFMPLVSMITSLA
jgi:type IV pilus assembly protein PilC